MKNAHKNTKDIIYKRYNMMETVNILFDDDKEILRVISNGGEIVKHLGYPDEKKCAFIGSKIQTKLGAGSQGTVFLISFPEMGTKQYVIKKGYLKTGMMELPREYWPQVFDEWGTDWNEVLKFQDTTIITEYEKATGEDSVALFVPPKTCKLQEPLIVKAIPVITSEKITIPKGSYLCKDEIFNEYVISVYVGQLYRTGQCIHFFNVYSFFACNNDGSFPQYILMDKLDGSLRDNKACLSLTKFNLFKHPDDIKDSLYVQTLFAIATYQKIFQISHNDLHQDNVFIDCITKDTMFNGQTLYDAKWFHYTINGKDIYIRASPGLVKIGDWGFSIKYSTPIIGDLQTFESGYDYGKGPWLSNQYLPSYDSLFFTTRYIAASGLFDDKNAQKILTLLLKDCLYFMCEKLDKTNINILDELQDKQYIKNEESRLRPVLGSLIAVKNAHDILLGPVMRHYTKKPTKGKIVTLGII